MRLGRILKSAFIARDGALGQYKSTTVTGRAFWFNLPDRIRTKQGAIGNGELGMRCCGATCCTGKLLNMPGTMPGKSAAVVPRGGV
jgi:hypothetical protein